MIKMATNEMPIHISNKNPKTYTTANCATYSRSAGKASSQFWDMIIVCHTEERKHCNTVA